ncbi:hypothetical protein B9Z65_5923 [Elsinoe australis]|uniref:Uncharacterized protein n=1 Tax=Elsinoe australis TaxID=40998 RepID=A0A2P7YJE9_9PEZI|nr:hypothetical protein B9Z65_5923 [Elsinoe australis]
MREEWATQGLTRGVNSQATSSRSSSNSSSKKNNDINRIQSLTMATKAMRLKPMNRDVIREREVSERRQVGDMEEIMASGGSKGSGNDGTPTPWWKNVGMDEGL